MSTTFDPDLKKFCDAKLDALKNLKENWDCEGAPPIDRAIIEAVRRFLDGLPEHFAKRPMIVPVSSGGVQLEWHHGRRSLELEFESADQVHYLNWDPDNQVEEEDIGPDSDAACLEGLIRWFMKGLLDA